MNSSLGIRIRLSTFMPHLRYNIEDMAVRILFHQRHSGQVSHQDQQRHPIVAPKSARCEATRQKRTEAGPRPVEYDFAEGNEADGTFSCDDLVGAGDVGNPRCALFALEHGLEVVVAFAFAGGAFPENGDIFKAHFG